MSNTASGHAARVNYGTGQTAVRRRTAGPPVRIRGGESPLFHREHDRDYPVITGGSGAWIWDANGNRYLDANAGGAFISTFGHDIPQPILDAYTSQLRALSYGYNVHVTNPPAEALAAALLDIAPDRPQPDRPGSRFTRVRLTAEGTGANEYAIRVMRKYWTGLGERKRHKIITVAQAYHGGSMATFALTGRYLGLHDPYEPYLRRQAHIPPCTWRTDPTGAASLAELDRILETDGDQIAGFFCEPVHAVSLPAHHAPPAFWEGLEARRRRYGFLVGFDEVVTGLGRASRDGSWFAADWLPHIAPDIITTGKVMSAGITPSHAMLVRDHVYQAAKRSGFEPGHGWDGAPGSSAASLAVLRHLQAEQIPEQVAKRGPAMAAHLAGALAGCPLVREVRGTGMMFGIEYADPRDGTSFLPEDLRTAARIDRHALHAERVLLYSSQPTADQWAGDQTLLCPALTITDAEWDEAVTRTARTVRAVAREIQAELAVW